MKRIVSILTIAGLMFLNGCGKNSEKETPVPTIGFSSVNTSVSLGNETTISLKVYDISQSIFGISMQIEYDSARVEFMGAQITDYGFFAEDPIIFAQNAGSVIHLTITQIQGQQEVSGSGTLAELSFQGISAGTSEVEVLSDELHFYDSSGDEVEFTNLEITNAVISVTN